MYYQCEIEIPNVKGKITKKTIKGTTYIYYKTGSKYNAKKRYTEPVNITIGKVSDTSPDMMYPNQNFISVFPGVELLQEEETAGRSHCLHIGAYVVIKKIIEEYGLDVMLSRIIGRDAGLVMDFAAYCIITESNVGQHYPAYAFNHPLFTGGMRIYSDSKLSQMLNTITVDQIIMFLNQWNERRNHREKIYISYDSTNKNCQSGDIEMAEYGKAKNDQGKPVINIGMAYDQKNREPLFYEYYPGSIPDVVQLEFMLESAQGYGYKNLGFILDRGYFSKDNIALMDANHYSFVIMVKGKKALVRELISENKGKFETDRYNYIKEYGVHGITIEHKLCESDEKTRYFHLYYSYEKYSYERKHFEDKLIRMERIMSRAKGREVRLSDDYEKYFNLYYGYRGDIISFLEDRKAVEEELGYYGYFVIITSEKMSAEEALILYKSRDASEKLFRGDKSYLGGQTNRTHGSESTEAKIFIEFIAMIIRSRIYTALVDHRKKEMNWNNYLSVPAAIGELEKLEMTKKNDGSYRIAYALTAAQKDIYNAFDISTEHVKQCAMEIQETLKNRK